MAYSDDLEKTIKLKIKKIKSLELSPVGCGVNALIAKLKPLDEPASIELNKEYISAIKHYNENAKK